MAASTPGLDLANHHFHDQYGPVLEHLAFPFQKAPSTQQQRCLLSTEPTDGTAPLVIGIINAPAVKNDKGQVVKSLESLHASVKAEIHTGCYSGLKVTARAEWPTKDDRHRADSLSHLRLTRANCEIVGTSSTESMSEEDITELRQHFGIQPDSIADKALNSPHNSLVVIRVKLTRTPEHQNLFNGADYGPTNTHAIRALETALCVPDATLRVLTFKDILGQITALETRWSGEAELDPRRLYQQSEARPDAPLYIQVGQLPARSARNLVMLAPKYAFASWDEYIMHVGFHVVWAKEYEANPTPLTGEAVYMRAPGYKDRAFLMLITIVRPELPRISDAVDLDHEFLNVALPQTRDRVKIELPEHASSTQHLNGTVLSVLPAQPLTQIAVLATIPRNPEPTVVYEEPDVATAATAQSTEQSTGQPAGPSGDHVSGDPDGDAGGDSDGNPAEPTAGDPDPGAAATDAAPKETSAAVASMLELEDTATEANDGEPSPAPETIALDAAEFTSVEDMAAKLESASKEKRTGRVTVHIQTSDKAMVRQLNALREIASPNGPSLPWRSYLMGQRLDQIPVSRPAIVPEGSTPGNPNPEAEAVATACQLNAAQRTAFMQIIHDSAPFCISGPAGSGKTYILKALTRYCYLKNENMGPDLRRKKNVIVNVPSNALANRLADALDEFHSKLPTPAGRTPVRVVRAYGADWEKQLARQMEPKYERKPSPYYNAEDVDQDLAALPRKIHDVIHEQMSQPFGVANRHVDRRTGTARTDTLHMLGLGNGDPARDRSEFLRGQSQTARNLDVVRNAHAKLSADLGLDADEPGRLTTALNELTWTFLACEADVIVTTTNNMGDLYNANLDPAIVFTDEAYRVPEPDALVSIAAAPCATHVFAGDELQVRPMAPSKHVQPNGPQGGTSLEIRGVMLGWRSVRLGTSRRAHPEIMKVAVAPFYPRGHITAARRPARPIETHIRNLHAHFTGKPLLTLLLKLPRGNMPKTTSNNPSKVNEASAAASVSLAILAQASFKIPMSSIAIVTPYRQQCTIIQRFIVGYDLAHAGNTFSGITVSTFDDIQGGECDYVIADIVAGAELGFVIDAERPNTAFSRAKSGLAVIMTTEFEERLSRKHGSAPEYEGGEKDAAGADKVGIQDRAKMAGAAKTSAVIAKLAMANCHEVPEGRLDRFMQVWSDVEPGDRDALKGVTQPVDAGIAVPEHDTLGW